MKIVGIVAAGLSFSIILGLLIFFHPTSEASDKTSFESIENQNLNSTSSQFREIQEYEPTNLTLGQINESIGIALSNDTIQKLIGGKPFKLMSQGFAGNYKLNPGVWYVQLNFNVDNKTQVVAVVDLPNKKVINSFLGIPMGTVFYPKYPPGASIGNRTLEVSTVLSQDPSSTNTHYLHFRFFDGGANQTVRHVTFSLNITKNNKSLMFETFHTDSGFLTLQLNSIQSPFNGTVFGDKEPIFHAWVSHGGDPVIVYVPLFNEADARYGMNIKLYSIDRDNNLFDPGKYPEFQTSLSIGEPSQVNYLAK